MTYTDLEWDSSFFRKRIGRIDLDENDKFDELKKLIDKKKDAGIELIYLFTPVDFILPTDSLYRNVDTRIVYEKNLSLLEKPIQVSETIKRYDGELNSDIFDLALVSGQYSRFKIDANFSEDDFTRLYRARIEKSLFEKSLFVSVENEQINGLVTIEYNEMDEVSIGLIAILPNMQRRGIGKKLMQQVYVELVNKDITKLTVATQLQNILASCFYEQCGMYVSKMYKIYHCRL